MAEMLVQTETIEITPEMIAAGVKVFSEDRFEDERPSTVADELLVRDIYLAMRRLMKACAPEAALDIVSEPK